MLHRALTLSLAYVDGGKRESSSRCCEDAATFRTVILNRGGHASPGWRQFPRGARPYALYSMEKLTNKFTNKYICDSPNVRGTWNIGQVLKAGRGGLEDEKLITGLKSFNRAAGYLRVSHCWLKSTLKREKHKYLLDRSVRTDVLHALKAAVLQML